MYPAEKRTEVAELFEKLLNALGPRALGSSRELSLARTKLEEAWMWAEKGFGGDMGGGGGT